MAARRGLGSCSLQGRRLQREYDAVVIGGGHNGLVAAAYLQKSGVRTAVLERRHLLGGSAVTEEIVPGFKFSRASYLLSLLRPQISTELELQRHGLRVYARDPYSFTPMLEDGQAQRSLLLGHDMAETQRQIAQFSSKDAQAYPKYEAFLSRLVSALDPLLDAAPLDAAAWSQGPLLQRLRALRGLQPLLRAGLALGKQLPQYYQVLTAPVTRILDLWFESEPLKATLATDAVIGAMASPHTPGSGYVLLHHVMGELEGRKGAWGYVAGGMGGVSQAIASAAAAHGADLFTEKPVARVLLGPRGEAQGVVLQDGTEVKSKLVLSNASAQLTFLQLVPPEQLPEEFLQHVAQLDTRSPVTKINVAVDRLPSFLAAPNAGDGRPLPHHQCSIHLNCEDTCILHRAFQEASSGEPSSSTPPTRWLAGGRGTSRSRMLTPTGNIFHGAMSLDQLYFARPVPSYSGYRSPVPGLYLCGSGAHPGGGVMGAAGRNAASVALEDFKRGTGLAQGKGWWLS
ncbi:pyridine nucleotide-disulfide oxidoreductase domain-containing protein 2 isoform X4 [Mauremys mutica]|uniref:pyridine nucleotide-disulfide oxidoreductase domain-containing protein 2 isoform X4 n=1 Tax=Mauremys mutica TaxID=74926 RepID=UPI001D16406D|nr:pyridine nucleotide-disulfide oxidoreductase domain-containing protein 2 isoform X4 [Mauremys mutica]